MEVSTMMPHIAQLALGGVTAFLAIYFWSQTRDTAWMLVIMGIVLRYLEITFSTLSFFGIIDDSLLLFGNIPLAALVLDILPYLFFSAALIIMIRRQHFR
ncbi:hypothetical protein [Marispirochaeta aestuarii]|uniref:hypothetical protein n=1 Tax=Marispirochaeta aestuarii TaxID=1963862 RepID=UPI0029C663D4|nr:hypothetical protein [Marispirochaeta aestuarii]